MQIVLSFKGK